MGLCAEEDFAEPELASERERLAVYPPICPPMLEWANTAPACMTPLPLQESVGRIAKLEGSTKVCHVNSASPYKNTALEPCVDNDVSVIEEYGISERDLRQIYISPHAYDDAFEEELNLATFNPGDHGTAGMEFELRDGQLILVNMKPGAPGHRIPHNGNHVSATLGW